MSSHTHHHNHHRPERTRGQKRSSKAAQPPGEASAIEPPAPASAPAAGPVAGSARHEAPAREAAAQPAQARGRDTTGVPGRSAGLGVLLRVVWMGLGNLALAGIAVTITQAGGRFGVRDGLYVVLIALLAGVRWLDITRYEGTTADGRPATLRDLQRYVVVLVAVAAGLLVVCHLAGRWLAGSA